MICYKCGQETGWEDSCPACGADMKIFKKVVRISNSYYNDGLQKAQVRNLSGAIISLRQSLKFYKYNIQARNLLGLVYYEMGEVVDALSEWVISANYQSEDNLAKKYIEQIQRNRNQLDTINQTIKKYNQALIYCKQDSKDLAVIQLRKVLSLNPKLVKAHQLIALLYIEEGYYEKAKKALRDAGKIDTDNTTTLRYLKEVNRCLKEKGKEKKKKNDDLISYQSGNETIIMPKRFRETSMWTNIVYLIIGLVVGVAVTSFLVVPGVQNKAKQDAKKQLLSTSDQLSTNGQTISGLNDQIKSLKTQLEDEQQKNSGVAEQIASYESLLNAYGLYASGDIVKTGEALENIKRDDLSDSAKQIYDTLNGSISDSYKEALYNQAYSAYSKGDYQGAIPTFQKLIGMDEAYRDGSAAYYLAQSFRKSGDLASAKQYYQYVVDNYPGTEKARTSKNYINQEQ